ncbi:MAG: argininosuccinate lyase [Promethearchaeota archaeon]
MKKNLLRSRLGEKLEESVIEFLSSLNEDREIFDEDILGTEVHNIMLYRVGVITFEELGAILSSLERIRNDRDSILENLNWTSFEDIHPVIENAVIEEIGIEIGGKLHSGRSRNDQVNMDMRLKARHLILDLLANLILFSETLLSLAEKYKSVPAPLYTHLQPAQIGVFGHYLLYYFSQNQRTIDRLLETIKRVNQNPLGACAVGGTSFPIDRELTTRLLNFDSMVENSLDAVSSRDVFVEILANLSILSTDLSRIAEDLIIFSSQEFGFVELDDSFSSVSSVMPQKKNPDPVEIIRGRSGDLIGRLMGVLTTVKGTPSGYVRDFQVIKPALFDALHSAISQVEVINGVFSTLKLREKSMERGVKGGKLNALDIAEFLVKDVGLSFREAHMCVGSLIRDGQDGEISAVLSKSRLEAEISRVTGKVVELPGKELDKFFSLEHCLDERISRGSPNLAEISRQISLFTSLLDDRKALVREMKIRLSESNARLEKTVSLAISGDRKEFDAELSSF